MKPYYTDPFTMLGLFGFYVTTKFLLFPTTKTIENLLTNMSHVSYFKLTLHDWIMEEMVKYISVSAFFFAAIMKLSVLVSCLHLYFVGYLQKDKAVIFREKA